MPEIWLTVSEAASAYPASEHSIRRWVRDGSLSGSSAKPLRVSRASLNRRRHIEAEWVTWAVATTIVGCSEPTIEKMVRAGVIVSRAAPRGVASLQRKSVERAAKSWKADRERRELERIRSESRALKRSDPPADGDVWLSTEVTAKALGITANRVRQRVAAGRMPATKKAGEAVAPSS